MIAPVPLEIEEDNEILAQREALLKNRRGRELASLIALENIAKELKDIRILLAINYDEAKEIKKRKGKFQ